MTDLAAKVDIRTAFHLQNREIRRADSGKPEDGAEGVDIHQVGRGARKGEQISGAVCCGETSLHGRR